jgi:hypothetical protein
LTACSSFRQGNLQPPHSWPPEATQGKKTISLLVTSERFVKGQRKEIPLKQIQSLQKRVAGVYADSGLFSEVKIGPADTDLQSEVTVSDFVQGMKPALAPATLFLFPVRWEDRFVVKTKIKDHDGQTLGSVETTETVSHWWHLFLLFIAPFNWPPTVFTDTFADLIRVSIVELHEGGGF